MKQDVQPVSYESITDDLPALLATLPPRVQMGIQQQGDTNNLLDKLLDKLAKDVGPSARDCVLQDHLKGRYSEVDMINGLVVEEFDRRGLSATANAAVAEITRQIRAGELKPDPANLELEQKMVAA